MSPDRGPVFAELPTGTGWDFGGLPYGLETVTLPAVGSPELPPGGQRAGGGADRYGDACRRIRLLRDRGAEVAGVDPCASPDELFWFRWITGHQVCFALWRLMAGAMDQSRDGMLEAAVATDLLCRYVRGYCAMLLYTGSCPRDLYHRVIRPSMRLRHPSFSGTWAPDYAPVRHLFRARPSALPWPADQQEELRAALRLHHLVHDGVAAKLVPGGRSLLRQSTAPPPDVRLLGVLYDTYFMTLRAPVTGAEIVAQLLRRLVAIAQDLAANGLHPGGGAGAGAGAEELASLEVAACEEQLVDILVQVATVACGLPAEASPLAQDRPVGAPSST